MAKIAFTYDMPKKINKIKTVENSNKILKKLPILNQIDQNVLGIV